MKTFTGRASFWIASLSALASACVHQSPDGDAGSPPIQVETDAQSVGDAGAADGSSRTDSATIDAANDAANDAAPDYDAARDSASADAALTDSSSADAGAPDAAPTPTPGSLALGTAHTCAVRSSGLVECWGSAMSSALGNEAGFNGPLLVVGLSSVSAISAGENHTCALLVDRTVKCWGSTGGFQADPNQTNVPQTIPELTDVSAIAASQQHTCALRIDGSVACWGQGPFGNGTIGRSSTPIPVPGLSGIVAIAGGSLHTCALRSNGTVVCWGQNDSGQLGDGTTVASLVAPVPVAGVTGATAISDTCAVVAGGSVTCWGTTTPLAGPGLAGATALAGGWDHTCALLSDTTIACWGNNEAGQLGDGSTISTTTPVLVLGLGGAIAIGARGDHSCAALSGGSIKCWGANRYSQLGNGAHTDSPTPVTALESGLRCDLDGQNCQSLRCGDAMVDTYVDAFGIVRAEQCDDGNASPADGCSAACQTEPGWTCGPGGEACRFVRCGDGVRDVYTDSSDVLHRETCEDGNALSNDGCSSSCTIETELGGTCDQDGACRIRRCGDGLIEFFIDANGQRQTETCDDSNATGGDGCTSSCSIEPGWVCPSAGGPCRSPRCGDGSIETYTDQGGVERREVCDNGNASPGDGCSASCQIEAGWSCKPIACAPTCTYDAGQCIQVAASCSLLLAGQPQLSIPWQGQITQQAGAMTGCPAVPRAVNFIASASFTGDGSSGWSVHVTTAQDSVLADAMGELTATDPTHLTATLGIGRCMNDPTFGVSGFGTMRVQVNCDSGLVSVQSSCQYTGIGTICARGSNVDVTWGLSGSALLP